MWRSNETAPACLVGVGEHCARFFFVSSARGQEYRLGTWSGSLEGVVDFDREDRKSSSTKEKTERMRTEERLRLGNSGIVIYDPRLMTLDLGGTFGLSQVRFESDRETTTSDGTLDGYDAFLTLFPEQATSLSLFSNRDNTFVPRELSGETKILTENNGGTLSLMRLYIPSRVSFRREDREEESRSGSFVSLREDRRDTFSYTGQRGWLNSDLDVRYEYVDLSDFVFPVLSFRSHDGQFSYGRDFGKDLDWHWDSFLRFFDRSGNSELTTWNLTELLRIEHSRELETRYQYIFNQTESSGERNTRHSGVFSLTHRLYENLTTTADLEGSHETLKAGERDYVDGGLDFAYTKRLPKGGRLNAGLGGNLRYNDDRFRSTETSVLQERYTAATPFALPITLNNRFVNTSSVVVTKVAVGPLPAGCLPAPGPPTPLVEGQDYTLRTTGNDATEIVPIACLGTTPGINPGDTIAVDYRYRVSPSLTYLRKVWNARVSVDYGWIRPFFLHEQTDESVLSGRDGQFLEDEISDTLGVEFRYEGERIRGNIVTEVQRYKSDREAYDAFRASQSLGFIILPRLRLSMTASESYTEFSRSLREWQILLAGKASVIYTLNSDLLAEVFTRADYFDDSEDPIDRTIEAGTRVQWFFRQVEVNVSLGFINRRRGETDNKEYKALLRVIRRF